MFTGLISDVGEIVSVEGDPRSLRTLRVETGYEPATIDIGASIACSGVCLTVVAYGGRVAGGSWIDFQTAAETLALTNASTWDHGTRLNLERSLRVGDELGGHIVTGHVDGIATVVTREVVTAGGGAWGATARFTVRAPSGLSRFIAQKGSVALDGTSLTVNDVDGDLFSVLLIPHTLAVTTWGERQAGDALHLEVDLMARYAARLMGS